LPPPCVYVVFKYRLRKRTVMVNVTVSLPEEVVRNLRRTVKERYGGRKGALSGLVREALEERISSLDAAKLVTQFKAFKGERQVAEGGSLDELASRLREREIDPRAVRIVSTTPLRQVLRAGLRGKPS
jgi:Arc/MetJ-type ribon-helix-helix transcriptional regulator